MEKRGQLLGLPLIYIFALVVGALILIWGVSTIFKLVGHSDELKLYTAIDDIKEQVRIFSSHDPGTLYSFTGREAFRVPEDILYACFTNPNEPPDINPEELNVIDESLPLLLETSQKNLHIIPKKSGKYPDTSFKVPNLRSTQNPLCIRTQAGNKGKLPFTIEVKTSENKVYVEVIE